MHLYFDGCAPNTTNYRNDNEPHLVKYTGNFHQVHIFLTSYYHIVLKWWDDCCLLVIHYWCFLFFWKHHIYLGGLYAYGLSRCDCEHCSLWSSRLLWGWHIFWINRWGMYVVDHTHHSTVLWEMGRAPMQQLTIVFLFLPYAIIRPSFFNKVRCWFMLGLSNILEWTSILEFEPFLW
jgi:hypothetical protein